MIYILEITNLLNIAYAIVYAVINNPALHWYQRAWPFLIVWYLQYYVISYYNQAMNLKAIWCVRTSCWKN